MALVYPRHGGQCNHTLADGGTGIGHDTQHGDSFPQIGEDVSHFQTSGNGNQNIVLAQGRRERLDHARHDLGLDAEEDVLCSLDSLSIRGYSKAAQLCAKCGGFFRSRVGDDDLLWSNGTAGRADESAAHITGANKCNFFHREHLLSFSGYSITQVQAKL